jgi:hypothetical protein
VTRLLAALLLTAGLGQATLAQAAPLAPAEAGVATNSVPGALKVGANADTGVDVYLGVRNGKPVYAGISNNVEARAAQHGARFDGLRQITGQSVTRGEARAIEEALIVRNPGFENLRHSISPTQPYYDEAVEWGEAWLKANGY